MGAVGDVLVLVAVELLAGHDLARHRRFGVEVAEHRHLDLAADDGLLDHDGLVVLEGGGDRVAQSLDRMGLRHADRRAHVGRLDEGRQTEVGGELGGQSRRELVLAEAAEPRLGDPGGER